MAILFNSILYFAQKISVTIFLTFFFSVRLFIYLFILCMCLYVCVCVGPLVSLVKMRFILSACAHQWINKNCWDYSKSISYQESFRHKNLWRRVAKKFDLLHCKLSKPDSLFLLNTVYLFWSSCWFLDLRDLGCIGIPHIIKCEMGPWWMEAWMPNCSSDRSSYYLIFWYYWCLHFILRTFVVSVKIHFIQIFLVAR